MFVSFFLSFFLSFFSFFFLSLLHDKKISLSSVVGEWKRQGMEAAANGSEINPNDTFLMGLRLLRGHSREEKRSATQVEEGGVKVGVAGSEEVR